MGSRPSSQARRNAFAFVLDLFGADVLDNGLGMLEMVVQVRSAKAVAQAALADVIRNDQREPLAGHRRLERFE